MLHNAFASCYKEVFQIDCHLPIILLMASLSLVGLSIMGYRRVSQETFKISPTASMQPPVASIERLVVLKVKISKITENKAIESYVKRINAIGDLDYRTETQSKLRKSDTPTVLNILK